MTFISPGVAPGAPPPPTSSSGGYDSITGPGETASPGALTQDGNWTIDGNLDTTGTSLLQGVTTVDAAFHVATTDVTFDVTAGAVAIQPVTSFELFLDGSGGYPVAGPWLEWSTSFGSWLMSGDFYWEDDNTNNEIDMAFGSLQWYGMESWQCVNFSEVEWQIVSVADSPNPDILGYFWIHANTGIGSREGGYFLVQMAGTAGSVGIYNTGSRVEATIDGLACNTVIEESTNLFIGGSKTLVGATSTELGFYGATPVVQASAPTTLAQVITLLTNLGLCA